MTSLLSFCYLIFSHLNSVNQILLHLIFLSFIYSNISLFIYVDQEYQAKDARLKEIEVMSQDGTFDVLPKKEVINIKKEWEKLEKNLGGIKNMTKIPDAIFVVDPKKEKICVQEAHTLGIPLIGIADTNCDPEELDYVIPGNDDAIRAVKLIVAKMADAVIEANQGEEGLVPSP